MLCVMVADSDQNIAMNIIEQSDASKAACFHGIISHHFSQQSSTSFLVLESRMPVPEDEEASLLARQDLSDLPSHQGCAGTHPNPALKHDAVSVVLLVGHGLHEGTAGQVSGRGTA